MQKFKKNIAIRITSEFLITLLLLIVAFNFFKIFGRPFKRGFFCDDESLKYPYRSDTVNGTILLLLSFYAPIFLMVAGESLLYLLQRKQNATSQGKGWSRALLKFHHNFTYFLCGFALHACFVHTAKIAAGRLRPHFFDVCLPYRLSDGSTCDNPNNHGIYIQDYDCNANNLYHISQHVIDGLNLSFPSGHSSYIFYGMTFIILYLQRFSQTLQQQDNRINVGLFMMVFQIFCALLAWFVAVSRVMDYKHHWSDVLVGIVLGTSVAIAVTLYACQQLRSVNISPADIKSSNSETTSSSTTTFSTNMPNTILVP